jgi:hypothetical protein
MALIGPMPATPGFLPLRTVAPQVFQNQKKSLAAGWGANQGTKDLPFPVNHLLPFLLIHSCRITFYTALFNSSTLYPRFVALHPPSSNHLSRSHSVGICHRGKHRHTDRHTSSPVALSPRRLLWEHTALRVVNTLNGLSADASHRLAAWAPWAYQRFNFASGLT